MEDNHAALGIGNWGTKGKKHPIMQSIVENKIVKSLDLYALSVRELKYVKKSVNNIKSGNLIVLSNCRNKAPYIEAIYEFIPKEVNLTKLSISSLKELVDLINECLTESKLNE